MLIDSLKQIADDFEQQRQAFLEKAKAQLQPALLDVFNKHPEIVAFGWTQYTPYFNDGDTCEFSVGDLYVTKDAEVAEEDSLWDWDGVYRTMGGYSEDEIKTLTSLEKILSSNEELLQVAFGDHVQVIVTPLGVDVEEYDHD